MTEKCTTLKYRVSALEKSYGELDKKIDKILQNCLPTIQGELVAVKTRVTVTTVINVGAVIAGLLLSKYL